VKEETTIYEQGNIKVTNARAMFGDKTYSISNISAVELETTPPNNTIGGLLIVIGVFMVIFAITTFIPSQNALRPDPNITMFILGILLAVGGYFGTRSAKSSYTVKFSSSSGEVKAMTSNDKESIKGIVDAINTAIIQR
jgi:hypothetical protein